MAQQIIDDIKEYLKSKNSFIMMGGAGSGKTHTLIQTVDYAVQIVGASKIGCVTYTNAAVEEIKHRCPYEKLFVGTIHDTLWDFICHYQNNLVTVYRELILNDTIHISDEEIKKLALSVCKIQYKEYWDYAKGIFTHDDLLLIADAMFKKYPLLLKIFADKYKFFFIDEYQDTFKVLIYICIDASQKYGVTVGLFGDSMQSIYENFSDEISIESRVISAGFKKIEKKDNFRCSKQVIELINKIRTDGILQNAAAKNEDGNITFLFSRTIKTLDEIRTSNAFTDWCFDGNTTKELLLTHSFISKELGFSNYLSAFSHMGKNSNSYAIGKKEGERHKLANYLFQIAHILISFENKQYSEVIKLCDIHIKSINDKNIISDTLNEATGCIENSCLSIAQILSAKGIVGDYNTYIDPEKEKDVKLIDNLNKVSMKEVITAYKYAENQTPFSTQHNIKGLEFNNVFVYLDNANWTKYNFNKLFSDDKSNVKLFDRTLKLVYVCFSRAKVNLVVYFPNPSTKVLETATRLFGSSNIKEIL